jgi:GNAT superfamily N-acetyltransferase
MVRGSLRWMVVIRAPSLDQYLKKIADGALVNQILFMKTKISVREMKTAKEMFSRFPLILQLNPKLERSMYEKMIREMIAGGYRMAGAFCNGKCIGLSGFWIATKIYSGRYVELDNVVIDINYRSQGVGKTLCDWIIKEARRKGCETAMLDAYAENASAHKFYLREGYAIRGFHFIRKI